MILKGSQRGFGQNLAAHLMNARDNEHIRLHELRGFASDTLKDALKEAEAISRATRCTQYLFSLSLSPPEDAFVPESAFEAAIERIEKKLGLAGQPRAFVFHEKNGRRHAHCVWSRIDAQTMTARPLPHFKRRLMDVSRELYLEHEWRMPQGMLDSAMRDPTNFTLAEWQQAKRTGVDPRLLKQVAQSCWERSDSRKAFVSSLEAHGYFLARGDRRGFVILDHQGEVYSLPRMLDLKTKEVRARLGEGDGLPDVAGTRARIATRMTPMIRRHIDEARGAFGERSAALEQRRVHMVTRQRQARRDLAAKQAAEWQAETIARQARLSSGLRGLWQRITGQYQRTRTQNEREAEQTRHRHRLEREALIRAQFGERRGLQNEIRQLRRRQAGRLLELRRDIGRFFKLAEREDAAVAPRQTRTRTLRLER